MQLESLVKPSMELLARMIAIPSLSTEEAAVADLLQAQLSSMKPVNLDRYGNNLVAIWRGPEPGPTLLLCSHHDTVAPATGWTRDPFKPVLEDGRLYGLGANDAGASVVSMIAAVSAITPLKCGTLILCLAAEEEKGAGGFVAIEPRLPRYNAAIFGEPTDLGVAASMRGSMKVELISRGIACHASRPKEGRNAIDQFAEDFAKIRSLDLTDDSPWGGTTIEPTLIRGGTSVNQIPDLVNVTLDIRTTPVKDNDWVVSNLKSLGVEFEVTHNKRRPMKGDPNHPIVRAIRKASPSCLEYAFNGSCDMAFATAPSVVLGPGKSYRSHAADEFCTYAEVGAAIEVYAGAISAYLSDAS